MKSTSIMLKHQIFVCTVLIFPVFSPLFTSGFVFPRAQYTPAVRLFVEPFASTSSSGIGDSSDVAVRSPLRFLGPFPTIPLSFPHLATASQRARNATGISLDFVVDTAANTNLINAQVVNELKLEKVGVAPAGVSAAGDIVGGDTFLLGDCELVPGYDVLGENSLCDIPLKNESFVFMQGLTASALPIASPAAAGLLSLSFLNCFEGGVEFVWGDFINFDGTGRFDGSKERDLSGKTPSSLTFYSSKKLMDLEGLTCVNFESLSDSMLPSVTLFINGVEFPALFDTGSPVTVMNARAAEAAGIEPAIPLEDVDPTKRSAQSDSAGNWNPFSKLTANIKSAADIARATARGEILAIAGSDGKPVPLVKSKSPQEVKVKVPSFKEEEDQYTKIGLNTIFIGDLPGLAALQGLGGDTAPPAAVLGMDFIRCRPRVIFRSRQNEIYL